MRWPEILYAVLVLVVGIAFLSCLTLSVNVAEAQRFTPTHTAIAVNATTTVVLAANNSRNFLLLINNSDVNIYCKFNAAAVINQGILLVANGGGLLLDYKFATGSLNCITASGNSKSLLVTEGRQ